MKSFINGSSRKKIGSQALDEAFLKDSNILSFSFRDNTCFYMRHSDIDEYGHAVVITSCNKPKQIQLLIGVVKGITGILTATMADNSSLPYIKEILSPDEKYRCETITINFASEKPSFLVIGFVKTSECIGKDIFEIISVGPGQSVDPGPLPPVTGFKDRPEIEFKDRPEIKWRG